MRTALTFGLLLSLTVAFIGCAEPPKQELDAAQAALTEAQQGEADVYAPETYQAAKDSLDAANARVTEQEQKWFKNYDTAKSAAIKSTELAQQSKTQAQTNKEAMRTEAQGMLEQMKTTLAEARTSIESAPRGKGADEDLDQLQASLTQVEGSMGEAKASLDANKVKDGLEQARAAQQKLTEVQGAVQAAIQKIEEFRATRGAGRRGAAAKSGT